MPTSYPHNISKLLGLVIAESPRSALDIGTGYGKWGFLLREYLDDFRWAHQIDGIEAWPDYVSRSSARRYYDHLALGVFPDARSELGPDYDLALMIDVLEHYEPDQGHNALDVALSLAPVVLISTPHDYPQGDVNGNPFERHRSEWRPEDIRRHGTFEDHSDLNGRSTIGLLRR
jgi:SAM-dependent methyltransferase